MTFKQTHTVYVAIEELGIVYTCTSYEYSKQAIPILKAHDITHSSYRLKYRRDINKDYPINQIFSVKDGTPVPVEWRDGKPFPLEPYVKRPNWRRIVSASNV